MEVIDRVIDAEVRVAGSRRNPVPVYRDVGVVGIERVKELFAWRPSIS